VPVARRPLEAPPGGLLLWIIVALELMTFALIFALLARLRTTDAAAFAAGQAGLDARFGLGLTLLLVTSGAAAARGVHRFREDALDAARRWFHIAGALGLAFVAVKMADTVQHFRAGHGLGVSDFWDAYVLATGFHLAHVVVGLIFIASVARRIGRTTFDDPETAVAGAALFWHMCDVAWFFLFPLFFAR
jgi:nitric oxide reductase NorE protein